MNSIDIEKLRKAVNNFKHQARPRNSNQNNECTTGDVQNVIDEITKMMNVFIAEFENAE